MDEPKTWRDLPHAPAPGTVLCAAAALADGECRLLALAGGEPPFSLILLRSGEEYRAYANRCPHFGVPLAKQQAQLIHQPHRSLSCNVHYSRFRWDDGVCESGECVGDRLLAVPLVVQDGQLIVAD